MKTHKERVEELNKYLSNLSEHHDMYVDSFSLAVSLGLASDGKLGFGMVANVLFLAGLESDLDNGVWIWCWSGDGEVVWD